MNENLIIACIITAVVSYLIGSCNFAIILSKTKLKDDVRKHGSGNAGMTNMLRTYGKGPAILTALGDGMKSIVAVMIARYVIFPAFSVNVIDPGYIAGIFVLIGHIFPIYFGFKGGKGVMTSLGAILAINPGLLVILLIITLPIVFATKIVSVGSILGAILFPIFTFIDKKNIGKSFLYDVTCAIIMGAIVLIVHKDNIKRLLNGTENRFSTKNKN